MTQFPQFISGLNLANLVITSDLLRLSCDAIKALQTEVNTSQQSSCSLSIKHKVFEAEDSNCTIIAFTASPIGTKDLILQQKDLVSSAALKGQGFPLFDFLCSKNNPSFSIHRAAITLFKAHFQELSHLITQIRDENTGELLLKTKLIATGNSIGGSVASLFTLWLLYSIKQSSKSKSLPLCITFGSPLIGDHGLQRAISEYSDWNSCFLHVASSKDIFPRIFITPNENSQSNPHYKLFGTFFLCSEFGCTCVDDPEVVERLLKSTINQVSTEQMKVDDYSRLVEHLKSRLIIRRNSQSGQPFGPPLRLGIILQLEAIGVEITSQQQQQQEHNINVLISELEAHESNRMEQSRKAMDPMKKLNEVKKKMAYLEWYKKDCKSKGIGYYNSYKNLYSSADIGVTRHKKFLTNYWKKLVEDAERKPQKEGAFIRETWLFSGTNYRRMVEPLDIAEYYRDSRKRDYQTNGRSKHYILLEKWHKEDAKKHAGTPNNNKKLNVAAYLTDDSCFWEKVEEALISCRLLKDETSSLMEKQSARESLSEFEQYVMDQINNYAVSPEIFLAKSSFMKWWEDFLEIIGTSHSSPLNDFMKNRRYQQYEMGLF